MSKDTSVKDKLDGNQLDLSFNSLAVIPVKEIAALPTGTASHIDLSSNLLTTIPADFCRLVNIVKLDLSQNSIESLPDEFGDFQRLQYLDLFNNKLTTLPVSFFKLKNLKTLDLKDNPLSDQLRSVAGDCLSEGECKLCAKRVVAHMRDVQAEQERRKQKELLEERKLEAARKVDEEKERLKRKAEKLAEKEKRRIEYEAKKVQEKKDQSDSDVISQEIDNTKSSDPLVNGVEASVQSSKDNGLSCCGVFIMSFLGLALVLVFCYYYCYTHRKDLFCMDMEKHLMPYFSAAKHLISKYITPI